MKLPALVVKADPSAALTWIEQLNGDIRDEALLFSLREVGTLDPKGALRLTGSIEDQDIRERVTDSLLLNWATADPLNARAYVASPESAEQHRILPIVAWKLAEHDLASTQQLLAKLPPEIQATAGRDVVKNPAAQNVHAAAELYMTLPSKVGPDPVIREIAGHWAHVDLLAAVAWLEALPATESKGHAFVDLAQKWAQDDAAAAAKWSATADLRKFGENASHASVNIAVTWGRNDAEAALLWSESLDTEKRETFQAGVVYGVMGRDPAPVIALTSKLSPAVIARMVVPVASAWARRDPAAAAEWVSTLEKPDLGALTQVVGPWLEKDPMAAISWVQGLAPGADRDGVVGELAYRVLQNDPEGALAWAETIGDERRREDRLESLAYEWMRFDLESAKKVDRSPAAGFERRSTCSWKPSS